MIEQFHGDDNEWHLLSFVITGAQCGNSRATFPTNHEDRTQARAPRCGTKLLSSDSAHGFYKSKEICRLPVIPFHRGVSHFTNPNMISFMVGNTFVNSDSPPKHFDSLTKPIQPYSSSDWVSDILLAQAHDL